MLTKLFGPSGAEVDLAGQELEELPTKLLQPEQGEVAVLLASRNRLRALPSSLASLAHLTRLELDDNHLEQLPAALYHLAQLAVLTVRNNRLTELAPELGQLRKLRVLAAEGNPLAWPPAHVLAAHKLPRVLEWMRDNPSYAAWRAYIGPEGSGRFVDLNIGTAHAQVKASKKNEDRWDNVILTMDGSDLDEYKQLGHIDLDKPHRMRVTGNSRPQTGGDGRHVRRCRGAFLGMYDGHGGNAAAAALQQNLYRAARKEGLFDVDPADSSFDWEGRVSGLFVDMDARLCDALQGLGKGAGSTCTVVLVLVGSGKVRLVVAHVGDSRAVAAVAAVPAFVELTRDHHPGDPVERAAVEARGGTIGRKKERSCLRVNGDLNMTRSMGDLKWKRPQCIISPVPDVTVLTLDEHYQSIVLASDGLWAYFNSEMGANYTRNELTAQDAAVAMVDKVKGWIEGTSHKGDNTSVTVLNLRWGQESSPTPLVAP